MTIPANSASLASELISKIEKRQAKVGIIGLGYVGLPLGLLYTAQKIQVRGFDIDQRKVDTLNAGGSYIHRIIPSEIQEARSAGFSATSDYRQISDMDAIIICVPTPLNEYHEPDRLSCSKAQLTRGQPKRCSFPFSRKKTLGTSRQPAAIGLPTLNSTSLFRPSVKIRAIPPLHDAIFQRWSVVSIPMLRALR